MALLSSRPTSAPRRAFVRHTREGIRRLAQRVSYSRRRSGAVSCASKRRATGSRSNARMTWLYPETTRPALRAMRMQASPRSSKVRAIASSNASTEQTSTSRRRASAKRTSLTTRAAHARCGHTYTPRPGNFPCGSTIRRPAGSHTRRTSKAFGRFARHARHVRSGVRSETGDCIASRPTRGRPV